MNQQLSKNYYELLNIAPDSSSEVIEDAYRQAMEVYGQESAALYSLYSDTERNSMLEELKTAYETLKDSATRRAYDSGIMQDVSEDETTELDMDTLRQSVTERPGQAYSGPVFRKSVALRDRIVVTRDNGELAAEQYRVLFTKLEHLGLRQRFRTFAVTSAVKGEGKTVTSVNLAYVMANDFKKKVVLVECDLKSPSIGSYFETRADAHGITDVLSGTAEIEDAVVRVAKTSLYVLPAQKSLRNSTELLGSERMRNILETLRSGFDYVILDAPPILPLADVNVLSKLVDGLLLVVRAGTTPKDMVVRAVNGLSEANVAGIVLNAGEATFNSYYYY